LITFYIGSINKCCKCGEKIIKRLFGHLNFCAINKRPNRGQPLKINGKKIDLKFIKFLSARASGSTIMVARTARGTFTFFCRDADGASAVGSSRSSYESSGGKQLPATAITMSKTHLQNVWASKYVHRATADVHSRAKTFASETAALFFGVAFMTGISDFRNDFRETFYLGLKFFQPWLNLRCSVVRIETAAPVKRVAQRTTHTRSTIDWNRRPTSRVFYTTWSVWRRAREVWRTAARRRISCGRVCCREAFVAS